MQQQRTHNTPSSSAIHGSHLTSQLTIAERNRLIVSDDFSGIEPDHADTQIRLRMGGRHISLTAATQTISSPNPDNAGQLRQPRRKRGARKQRQSDVHTKQYASE
eukprot:1436707-Rhodomonas_salina.2